MNKNFFEFISYVFKILVEVIAPSLKEKNFGSQIFYLF